jgi:hypothetical protein
MERDLSGKNILRVFFSPVYSNSANWVYALEEFYIFTPKSLLSGSACVSAYGNKERGAVDMGLLLFMCDNGASFLCVYTHNSPPVNQCSLGTL